MNFASATFLRSIPTSDPIARRYYAAAADQIETLTNALADARQSHDFASEKWRKAEAQIVTLKGQIDELRTAYQTVQTARDECERQFQDKVDEVARLQHALEGATSVNADEIARLRGWLAYIAGNFGGREAAGFALNGKPVPEDFNP